MELAAQRLRTRIRWVLGFFIAGLVLSGITAFPLLYELEILSRLAATDVVPVPEALRNWIFYVAEGLSSVSRNYPFLSYGTDWLAFGHLVIALFFVGPMQDPVRNRWVLHAGLIACAGVIPLAMICGPIRGIPFYWRLIDCSFGILGALPLWYVLRLTSRLEKLTA